VDHLKDYLKDGATPPTPFEFLMYSIQENPMVYEIANKAFAFFLREPVTFFTKEAKIVVGDLQEELKKAQSLEDLRCITNENFFDFQNTVRRALGEKPAKPPEPFDPDEDPRIRRIKEKARERDRIKKKQGV
jgi:hypothetical protein